MVMDLNKVIAAEREKIDKQRAELLEQRAEIDSKISNLDSEVEAIDAYERIKLGKSAPGRGRRSGIRKKVLAVIENSKQGIGRSDILIALELKGDKSGEQSVSNALSALKKTKAVSAKDGKYKPAS
jgi:hypothetical protein